MPIAKGQSRYKHGKQMQTIDFDQIHKKVEATRKTISSERESFFWLLYYTGCRKSEAYERKVDDCNLTETQFTIDFGKRKKGGLSVPPIKLPRILPGIELLCKQHEKAKQLKPSRKRIAYSPMKNTLCSRVEKSRWLFPHINRTWAIATVKKILGENYYPHFLRLNRISEICRDPTSNIARIASFTGIKSLDVIEHYLGVSEKEQDAAVDYMAKQISQITHRKTRALAKKRLPHHSVDPHDPRHSNISGTSGTGHLNRGVPRRNIQVHRSLSHSRNNDRETEL